LRSCFDASEIFVHLNHKALVRAFAGLHDRFPIVCSLSGGAAIKSNIFENFLFIPAVKKAS
jgi:hypothetical protein